MRQGLHICSAVLCAVLAMAFGQGLPAVFSDRLPQVACGDILTLILGDARLAFSDMMLKKADEYFHGGVKDAVCDHGLSEAHETHDHEHEHGHEDESGQTLPGGVGGLWSWVNGQVHTQEDRHAQGEDTRELLPWLWLACRASPQNIQAYETSAYVLEGMLKRPSEAVLLLEEGIRNNPGCAELEFALGKMLLHKLSDDTRAERAFRAALEKCRPAEGPDGDAERFLRGNILFYLGFLAKKRGDWVSARDYLAKAEAFDPAHVGTRDLRKLLKGN